MSTSRNKNIFFTLFALISISLLLSACSSGGSSGGSTVGTGSSSVEGNITSSNLAMLPNSEGQDSSIAEFFTSLLFTPSAYADSSVAGVIVGIGQLTTVSDANGYFRIDGVPPGTHEVVFSKNNQSSSMTVSVGENETASMQGITVNGSRAYAQGVSHQRHDDSGYDDSKNDDSGNDKSGHNDSENDDSGDTPDHG